jgi:hypothetical protein
MRMQNEKVSEICEKTEKVKKEKKNRQRERALETKTRKR